MALTKAQKTAQVKDLTEKFKSAQSVMFTNYIGLTVAEVSELRRQLKEQDAEMQVAKKTLLKIAAKDANVPEISDDLLDGPVSCIFSFIDPMSGAQAAFKFGKDHKQVKIIGGIFDGKVLSKEEAIELAKMPSRAVLLATFAMMLKSPLNTFAGMCASPLSGFARALSEMADKGGFGDDEAAPEEENKVKDEKEVKETVEDTSETAENSDESSAAEPSDLSAEAPQGAKVEPSQPSEPSQPKEEES
ncbi:50S ribosomal protein L10 [Patescibacteria group bacterium]|nr:50S ribosomal protein L10 [Patescibacteria group bacterium]MBU1123178.1 50S ribosomal protein L10 [Patescibacteria group bacterium]